MTTKERRTNQQTEGDEDGYHNKYSTDTEMMMAIGRNRPAAKKQTMAGRGRRQQREGIGLGYIYP